MKKILYIALLPAIMAAQANNQNYVKTINYKVSSSTSILSPSPQQAIQNITYFDGLGRPIQQIAVGLSASGKNIITPIEYDAIGRETKEYLPYVSQGSGLNYNPGALTDVLNYTEYLGRTPYGQKVFENSPISRVLKQAAPGTEWNIDSGKQIKINYETNLGTDEVKLYSANAVLNAVTGIYDVLLSTAMYGNNQLYKDIVKDENWVSGVDNTTESFKDKEGRVILKRAYNGGQRHDTYYVYDQYNNLSYVIPPLASDPATQLDDLCFQYKYDQQNMLAEKKLPGKQWEYMAYDKLGRLVASGPTFSPFDGTGKGWIITKYDEIGRIAYTGWYQNSGTRKSLQDQINASNILEEKRSAATMLDNISIAYTNLAFPTSGMKLLSINYYDDYAYPNAPSTFAPVEGQDVFYNTTVKPRGLLTGKWNRVLTGSTSTAGELTYTLYDYKARPISIKTTNYLGGYSLFDSRLDFSGKIMYTVTRHKRTTAAQEIKVTERYKYTDQDRLISQTHQIGDQGQEQLLALNSYDELGKLTSKKVGGTDITGNSFLQKIDYSYNIRGWLTGINSIDHFTTDDGGTDLFALSIGYNDISGSPDSNLKPLFNGNISQTSWISRSDNKKRSYTYKYDALNRLLYASYFKDGRNTKSYDEWLDYDKNGNILSLGRNGDLDYDSFAIEIDELSYNYKGNMLKAVKDASGHPAGFNNGAEIDEEYKYDGNGNMITDENKGIISISYNHMNLPVEIFFKTGGKIKYLYDASGKKLKKTVTAGSSTITTDYLSGFQYVSDKLDFFPTAEGYVKWVEDRYYAYVFNYTDHLGNIRMSYGMDIKLGKLAILEENHYYPFGMKHEKYNSDKYEFVKNDEGSEYPIGISPVGPTERKTYQYKFQGQEWQDELGLNINFFKFRMSDPAIGRFLQIDPLSQVYAHNSPFAFAENNVTSGTDLEGLELSFNLQGDRATAQYGPRVTGGVNGNYTLQELRSHIAKKHAEEQKVLDLLMSGDPRALPHDQLSMPESNINVARYSNPGMIMADGTLIGAEIMSIDAAIGKGLKGLAFLSKGRGIWLMDGISRGRKIEEILGANTTWAKNFPTIDKIENGVATSIKSMDLTAASYQKGNRVYNTLRKYIDQLIDFKSADWGGTRIIEGRSYTSKALEVAFQPGTGSEAQWEQIFRAIQYALDNNINLVIKFIN